MTKVSIIIVNYKSWSPLKECLDSILASEGKVDFKYEVIVVDNRSDDGKLNEFSSLYPSVKFIENEGNYGFSNGNNLGSTYATGNYLLFLNPDTIVSAEPLNYIVNFAKKKPEYSLYSLQQKRPSGDNEYPFNIFPSFWTVNSIIKSIYQILSHKNLKNKCIKSEVISPDWVSGSFILIKESIFNKMGRWDDSFWLYSEDIDLCKRSQDNSGPIAMICNKHITHKHGGSTRTNIKLTAFFKSQVHISKHIYFRKHYSGINHLLIQLFFVTNSMLLENLIPAIIGIILFPIGKVRKYSYLYLYLLRYYFTAIKKRSWYLDIKNIKIPQ